MIYSFVSGNKKMKKILTVLLFICISHFAFSQHFAITPFAGNGSFPSNELHGIVEDEAGAKWVASDAGLICITGNQVKVFTKKDGLASDVILRMYKDQWHRIWLAGVDGSLSLIDNGKIIAVPANNSIRQMNFGSRGVIAMYAGSDRSLYVTLNQPNTIIKLSPDLTKAEKILQPQKINNGKMLFPFQEDLAKQKVNFAQLLKFSPVKQEDSLLQKDSSLNGALLYLRTFYQAADNTLYFANDYDIVAFKNGSLVKSYKLPGLVYGLMEIDHQLLVAVAGQGLYTLDKDGPVPLQNILSKKTITSFCKDTEGNLWIATLEKGLFVIHNINMNILYDNDANITGIMFKNGEPIILTDKVVLDRNGSPVKGLPPVTNNLYDVAFRQEAGKDIIFQSTRDGLLRFSQQGRKLISKEYFAAHIDITAGRQVFWGTHDFCIYGDKGKIFTKRFTEKIMCVAQQSDSFLLLGTFASGILRLHITDSIQLASLIYSGRVNCIQKISEHVLAIGTNEDGVQLIDDKGKLLMSYKGIPNRIQALVKHGHLLFAGTKEGLYIIDLEKNTVTGLNNTNGLPVNEINAILVQQDTLYFAGTNIAAMIPLKALLDYHSSLRIGIAKATVNNRQLLLSDLTGLSYPMNNFAFTVENYSYRAYLHTIYHYEVRQGDKVILRDSSTNTNINFSLEPGKYLIEITAEDVLLRTRSNIISVPVNIAAAFYSRLWFIALAALAFMLITVLITAKLIKRVKTKERLKRELVVKLGELEARALQGQMNPHFIFNAVNSVQDFILSNRNEEAHHYLSAFAKLVRMVLESNRKKNSTIEEEISLLQLYVSLEEQRMKDKLQLEFHISEAVEKDNVLIPSMLLQPIVENAIWHGLSGQEGNKKISISFDTNDSFLYIAINDNGRGLQQPGDGHASVGLEIVRERIRLAYDHVPAFEYFSIDNKKENGVLVNIVLPLQTAY
jgi:hypothetical protein